jgi:hypothetical protein
MSPHTRRTGAWLVSPQNAPVALVSLNVREAQVEV